VAVAPLFLGGGGNNIELDVAAASLFFGDGGNHVGLDVAGAKAAEPLSGLSTT